MSLILLLAAITAAPDAPAVQPPLDPLEQAALTLHNEMQTGTLLVSKGDCLAIKVFSHSDYTHVAAVVIRDGQPFVYDSTNGVGVRCQTLANYLKSQSPDEIHMFQPAKPFSEKRAETFTAYLDSQLGRPYAVRHHLTGKRAEGVHCSEYLTDAFIECRMLKAQQPSRVSPASLIEGATQAELYTAAQTVALKQPSPAPPQGSHWCEQLWIDTKVCTSNCCRQMRRWFLCE